MNRPDQTLRHLRKVNMRVDTIVAAINHNIKSTKKEGENRKKPFFMVLKNL